MGGPTTQQILLEDSDNIETTSAEEVKPEIAPVGTEFTGE